MNIGKLRSNEIIGCTGLNSLQSILKYFLSPTKFSSIATISLAELRTVANFEFFRYRKSFPFKYTTDASLVKGIVILFSVFGCFTHDSFPIGNAASGINLVQKQAETLAISADFLVFNINFPKHCLPFFSKNPLANLGTLFIFTTNILSICFAPPYKKMNGLNLKAVKSTRYKTMCYSLATKEERMAKISLLRDYINRRAELEPVYVANSFTHPALPVLTVESPGLVQKFRWELIAYWVKDIGVASEISNKWIGLIFLDEFTVGYQFSRSYNLVEI
jgi:hypothetical protein